MNRLDQIKHNLERGLPIDVEETLSAIRELEQERDELMTHCTRQRSLIDEIVNNSHLPDYIFHNGIQDYSLAKLKTIHQQTPKQSLAEIQAKAIEDMADYIFTDKIGAIPRVVLSYAENLRQQAKEQQ